MITDIKMVPNSDLQLFVNRLAYGLIAISVTDDNVMVVGVKRFNSFTGQELPERDIIAAIPVADILTEAARVQAEATERVSMLQAFIASENFA